LGAGLAFPIGLQLVRASAVERVDHGQRVAGRNVAVGIHVARLHDVPKGTYDHVGCEQHAVLKPLGQETAANLILDSFTARFGRSGTTIPAASVVHSSSV